MHTYFRITLISVNAWFEIQQKFSFIVTLWGCCFQIESDSLYLLIPIHFIINKHQSKLLCPGSISFTITYYNGHTACGGTRKLRIQTYSEWFKLKISWWQHSEILVASPPVVTLQLLTDSTVSTVTTMKVIYHCHLFCPVSYVHLNTSACA